MTWSDRKSARLDALLLAPLADLLAGAPLVIVPTSGLHAMPWAVLPSAAGPADFGDAVGRAVAPGGDRCRRSSDGRQVLVSGPGSAACSRARSPPSPADIRRRIVSPVRRALVDPVIAALDGAELAHIAAHGHFRADNPLFSSLELHDGPLTVHDLEGLRRAPRQVVLSACESGLPTVHPGRRGGRAGCRPAFPGHDQSGRHGGPRSGRHQPAIDVALPPVSAAPDVPRSAALASGAARSEQPRNTGEPGRRRPGSSVSAPAEPCVTFGPEQVAEHCSSQID